MNSPARGTVTPIAKSVAVVSPNSPPPARQRTQMLVDYQITSEGGLGKPISWCFAVTRGNTVRAQSLYPARRIGGDGAPALHSPTTLPSSEARPERAPGTAVQGGVDHGRALLRVRLELRHRRVRRDGPARRRPGPHDGQPPRRGRRAGGGFPVRRRLEPLCRESRPGTEWRSERRHPGAGGCAAPARFAARGSRGGSGAYGQCDPRQSGPRPRRVERPAANG